MPDHDCLDVIGEQRAVVRGTGAGRRFTVGRPAATCQSRATGTTTHCSGSCGRRSRGRSMGCLIGAGVDAANATEIGPGDARLLARPARSALVGRGRSAVVRFEMVTSRDRTLTWWDLDATSLRYEGSARFHHQIITSRLSLSRRSFRRFLRRKSHRRRRCAVTISFYAPWKQKLSHIWCVKNAPSENVKADAVTEDLVVKSKVVGVSRQGMGLILLRR